MWILVFILYGQSSNYAGKTSLVIEFSSKQACETAKTEMDANYGSWNVAKLHCLKK